MIFIVVYPYNKCEMWSKFDWTKFPNGLDLGLEWAAVFPLLYNVVSISILDDISGHSFCHVVAVAEMTGDGSVSETELSESVFINGLNSRL